MLLLADSRPEQPLDDQYVAPAALEAPVADVDADVTKPQLRISAMLGWLLANSRPTSFHCPRRSRSAARASEQLGRHASPACLAADEDRAFAHPAIGGSRAVRMCTRPTEHRSLLLGDEQRVAGRQPLAHVIAPSRLSLEGGLALGDPLVVDRSRRSRRRPSPLPRVSPAGVSIRSRGRRQRPRRRARRRAVVDRGDVVWPSAHRAQASRKWPAGRRDMPGNP